MKADLKKAQEIAPGDKGKLQDCVVVLHFVFQKWILMSQYTIYT